MILPTCRHAAWQRPGDRLHGDIGPACPTRTALLRHGHDRRHCRGQATRLMPSATMDTSAATATTLKMAGRLTRRAVGSAARKDPAMPPKRPMPQTDNAVAS